MDAFRIVSVSLAGWSYHRERNHLEPGDVALTDRGFNSYEATAQLKEDRGGDSVMRLHQRRKVDFRRGKRLGDHDRLQTWLRPQRPKDHHMTKGQWAGLPGRLEVRVICELVPERPRRSEPRAKKRRPETNQLMTAPRGQMKVSESRRNK